MQITTILPVSRVEYLDRVLESLNNQTVKPTALIVVFDGSDEQFIQVRNKIVGLDYQGVRCIKSTNTRPAFAISERRQHIANIHNQIRELLHGDVEWFFSIEDDGILPPNALERLLIAAQLRKVGMVSGVELGRWGVPYVGAWGVDNIYQPTTVVSMRSRAGEDLVEEIDGSGLYCSLIRPHLYLEHQFDSVNGLGPDVNLGLFCKQQGYRNYIDWGILVTHLTNRNGLEMEIPATDLTQVVSLSLMGHNTWHQVKYPYGQPAPGQL